MCVCVFALRDRVSKPNNQSILSNKHRTIQYNKISIAVVHLFKEGHNNTQWIFLHNLVDLLIDSMILRSIMISSINDYISN